jgi:cytochrome c-type biogenesis protein CcmH
VKRRCALVAAPLAIALLAVASLAPAATHRASIGEIEAEVMCPVCGTLLELAESPQAQRQKAFIARLIAAGRSKQQIKDALVAEYGHEVLALPQGSGFSLSAYLVPVIAFAIAVAALAVSVLRWRRASSRDGPRAAAAAGPNAEDAERLDADIARYDL